MIALLRVEVRKLRGSLALLLAAAAPALPGVLATLSLVSSGRPVQWASIFTGFILPIWCLFLLPMVVAAFTTLVAQVEHRARGWDHLLALPLDRWRIFLVKAIVVLAASALMTLLVLFFTGIGALGGGLIGGNMPRGSFPWALLVQKVPMLLASATLLVAIQLWVALRFTSFVVPLLVGIGGTLVAMAVTMTRTDQAAWFPWVLPLNVLSGPEPMRYALFGLVGGVIVVAAMISDLSRRHFR